MKRPDVAFLLVFGLAFWIMGTVYYGFRGQRVLEGGPRIYWINFSLAPILSTVVCIMVLKLRNVPPSAWSSAMLLVAIPGMVGEAIVLTHLSTFMPRIQMSSGGRYGAFLFATYAMALGFAEIITLRTSVR